jgi:hypothetical protein
METKESDESVVDYEFLKKYIRDDDSDKSKETIQLDFSQKFKTEKQGSTGTEILSREGEGESYREETSFNKKPWQKNKEPDEPIESDDSNEDIIPQSKPPTEAKKEFLEHLEDESLTLDTAVNL